MAVLTCHSVVNKTKHAHFQPCTHITHTYTQESSNTYILKWSYWHTVVLIDLYWLGGKYLPLLFLLAPQYWSRLNTQSSASEEIMVTISSANRQVQELLTLHLSSSLSLQSLCICAFTFIYNLSLYNICAFTFIYHCGKGLGCFIQLMIRRPRASLYNITHKHTQTG